MMRVMMTWGFRGWMAALTLMDHEHLGRCTMHRVVRHRVGLDRHGQQHMPGSTKMPTRQENKRYEEPDSVTQYPNASLPC